MEAHSGCRWLHTYNSKTCLLHLAGDDLYEFTHIRDGTIHTRTQHQTNTQSRTLLLITRTRCTVLCVRVCVCVCVWHANRHDAMYFQCVRACKWCAQMVVRVEREHILISMKKKKKSKKSSTSWASKRIFSLCLCNNHNTHTHTCKRNNKQHNKNRSNTCKMRRRQWVMCQTIKRKNGIVSISCVVTTKFIIV